MLKDLQLLPFFINEDLVLLPEDRPQLNKREGTAGTGEEIKTVKPSGNIKAPTTTAQPGTPNPPTTKSPEPTSSATSPKKSKPAPQPTVNPNLIFGKNQKELLVLVEDYNNPVMERNDGLLLKDILKAIGYTFDDVAIVNISHCREEVDWEAVNNISYQTLFSFGITHPKIPVTAALAPYELEMSKDRKFLLTDKLSILREDRSRKIALWNLLKKFFV